MENIRNRKYNSLGVRTRFLKTNESIIGNPRMVYNVSQGLLKITNNEEIIFKLVTPYETVKLSDNQVMTAERDSTVVTWNYLDKLHELPRLRDQFLINLSQQQIKSEELIQILAISNSKEKIFRYLRFWCSYKESELIQTAFLSSNPNNLFIKVPFNITHSEIAANTGLTRVTVTRLIKELRNEGLLLSNDTIIKEKIFVLDVESNI